MLRYVVTSRPDQERRGFVPLVDLVDGPWQEALVVPLGALACVGWNTIVERLMG
jgi:hypothetical protein